MGSNMMSHFTATFAMVCGLTLALAGGRSSQAEDPSSDPAARSVVNEIKQQLELRGGTVLKGTSFAPAAGEVDEALRRELQLRLARQQGGTEAGTPRAVASPAEANSADQARLLRHSARQLEEVAHQLEELGLYEQADQLREQAQQFRVQSRSLLSARSPRALVR